MNLDEIITLEPLSGPAVIPTPTEQQPIKYNNMFFLLSCIIVMASSWCCGYNIGLTYIPLKRKSDTSYNVMDIYVANVFVLGILLGSVCDYLLSKRKTVKFTLVVHLLFVVLSTLSIIFTVDDNLPIYLNLQFILSRLFAGVHGGFTFTLIPAFLNKFSRSPVRGDNEIINVMFSNFGIVVSQVFSLRQMLGNNTLWRLLYIMPIFLSILALICLSIVPEKFYQQAKIRKRFPPNITNSKTNYFLTSFALNFCQQLCGVFVIFFFNGEQITKKFDSTDDYNQMASLCFGVSALFASFLSIFLLKKFCCRNVMIVSMNIIIIGYCLLIVCLYYKDTSYLFEYGFISISCIIIFAYSIGPGIVPQIYVSSFYKKKYTRDLSYFGCIILNWSVIFFIKCAIQYTDEYFKNYVFVFFALLTFISMLFVIGHVPKWKNN